MTAIYGGRIVTDNGRRFMVIQGPGVVHHYEFTAPTATEASGYAFARVAAEAMGGSKRYPESLGRYYHRRKLAEMATLRGWAQRLELAVEARRAQGSERAELAGSDLLQIPHGSGAIAP